MDKPDINITVAPLISHRTQQPLVDFTVVDARVQLTPAKARGIALMLLDAAASAEQDAGVFKFMKSMDYTDREAAAFLQQLRAGRGALVEGKYELDLA